MTPGEASPAAGRDSAARREELAARLDRLRSRVAAACQQSGRSPHELSLVVVTKEFPASDADLLAELGVTDLGENRDQEAAAKVAAMTRRDQVRVHFIGQLQTNKAASVARYADVVQSLDRPRLVRALDRGLESAGRRVAVLVQVRLDDAPGRGGVHPDEALELAGVVAGSSHLDLRGVMGVAPLGVDPTPAFTRLREVADGIRAEHPEATWISAGMSDDLEQAIAEGATHLRVGTAILGSRASHR